MNHPNKNIIDTIDAVVEDIIAEMSLNDRVRTANLDEDGLTVLQLALGKCLRYLLNNQSKDVNKKLLKDCIKKSGNKKLDEAEAAGYILKELWKRWQETHKLRVIK